MNTAKEMLAEIDTFLADHAYDGEGGKLWDVLCALRGPDNEAQGIKTTTTMVIRGKALPMCLHAISRMSWYPGPSGRYPAMTSHIKFEIKENDQYRHFSEHAQAAYNVLVGMEGIVDGREVSAMHRT